VQAKDKERRYLRRQQRRAELEEKRREKSTIPENVSSAAVLVNTSGILVSCKTTAQHSNACISW